jgi:integrase
VSQKTADEVRVKVERLAAAVNHGTALDDETARWLADRDDDLYNRLVAVGLASARDRTTLKAFAESYIDGRVDVKPLTKVKYRSALRTLIAFFGPDMRLRDITPGDADDWRRSFATKGIAENTIRKYTAVAKLFFGAAAKKHLVRDNPFSHLKATIQPNRDRFYFVTREETQKIIDACPDSEWRLIVALARYGGLRCPSEHLGLKWRDIDWEHGRMKVTSPKTAHHVGGESRMVPLFPELRPHLEAMFDEAPEGAEYVLSDRYRSMKTFDLINFRSRLLDIIAAAGLKPWPKLFQNMRSTRQTELSERFPSHVVCAWLGNSEAVAAKHYLQVTDEHYARALEGSQEAVQNPVQHPAARPCSTPQFPEKCESLQGDVNVVVAEAGLEPARPVTGTGF